MSTSPAEAAVAPPKSKKLLLLVVLLVVMLVVVAGGAYVYVLQQRAAIDLDEETPAAAAQESKGPPTYLPLDNMVVNLADPGGERVAQIGITLELADSAASDRVKMYLPTIRSSVLMLMSQRTSVELLQREGKEKLAHDILREASRPFGGRPDDAKADEVPPKEGQTRAPRKNRAPVDQPVRRVLFSSFIVQ